MAPAASRTALVTGGAIRVGRGIVESLIAADYRVWVHFHTSQEAAAELKQTYGPAVAGLLQADLTQADDRHRLATSVGPKLDLLVNSAASYERGSFEERSAADLRRVLDLNLIAPLDLVRQCLPALRAAAGTVVQILDVGAMHPWPGYLDHCVSKAALKTATEALAVELAPLRVNAVAPGTVDWPADGRAASAGAAGARVRANIPRGQIGTPADVGAAVCFLANAEHVSGHTLAVDGGRLAGIAGPHG